MFASRPDHFRASPSVGNDSTEYGTFARSKILYSASGMKRSSNSPVADFFIYESYVVSMSPIDAPARLAMRNHPRQSFAS